jgi:hypothetical protein
VRRLGVATHSQLVSSSANSPTLSPRTISAHRVGTHHGPRLGTSSGPSARALLSDGEVTESRDRREAAGMRALRTAAREQNITLGAIQRHEVLVIFRDIF